METVFVVLNYYELPHYYLNPEIIEKQRQEQENKALREEINSLKEMFKEFINTSLKQEKHGNNN